MLRRLQKTFQDPQKSELNCSSWWSKSDMQSMWVCMILRNRMRWCGYTVRMVDERTPKQLFYGELTERKRYWYKPKIRFKDGIRTIMKLLGMNPEDIEILASDQAGWQTRVWNGIKAFEEARITHARLKRDLRRNVMIKKVNHNDLFNVLCQCLKQALPDVLF
ncbi:Hypothetical predicted protein [Octopus vulgaris]|uniref:Uncharacterized protein n=1 Tax=Octopus vulgaris TaxID=6645 RepID=A0AA36AVA8_OCTVU|nr:Hypothetical predicted protein [Octopus vulgaris]